MYYKAALSVGRGMGGLLRTLILIRLTPRLSLDVHTIYFCQCNASYSTDTTDFVV